MSVFLVFFQRRKALEGVFVPTSLKNLMVAGVFGDKVSVRAQESCTHLQLLFHLYIRRALI